MKCKAFFIILNELSLKQIKQFFFEGKKSPTLKGLFLRGLTLGSLLFSHKTSFQTFFTKKRKLAEPCLTTPPPSPLTDENAAMLDKSHLQTISYFTSWVTQSKTIHGFVIELLLNENIRNLVDRLNLYDRSLYFKTKIKRNIAQKMKFSIKDLFSICD